MTLKVNVELVLIIMELTGWSNYIGLYFLYTLTGGYEEPIQSKPVSVLEFFSCFDSCSIELLTEIVTKTSRYAGEKRKSITNFKKKINMVDLERW